MTQNQPIDRIRQVKAKNEQMLLKLPNVIGVGVGLKEIAGQFTDQLAIIVNVSEKKPLANLQPAGIIPAKIEGVITDVQEVGQIKAL